MLEGTGFSMFFLAHYLLAVKYLAVATQVPLILMGKTPEKPSQCMRVLHWVMLSLNVFSGILDGLAVGYYDQ